MKNQLSNVLAFATVVFLGGAMSYAQNGEANEPDPAAAKEFKQLVSSYRNRPALTVKTTMKLKLVGGELSSDTDEVKAEFTYSRGGAGIVKLRGFTSYFRDGQFIAIHDDTEDSYYTEEYDDNPYWTFLLNYLDIPFPHLGLLWGEVDMEDVYMQLHPQSDSIVPTSVEDVEVKGKKLRRIILSSPNASMRIDVDPKTKLIQSIEHEITGGAFVQPGTKTTTVYSYEYEVFDKPLEDSVLTFDPGPRQRVDMIATLMPPLPAALIRPAGGGGDGGGGGGGGALIGKPAPLFTLETADGQVMDLEKLRGQVVVLDFWATWCVPCRRGLPLLHDIARWADEQDLPVRIYTVNILEHGDTPQERLDAVNGFWKKEGFTLPVIMDYKDETAGSYGVNGIPTTVIIRADGVVEQYHVGLAPVEMIKDDITAALEALQGDD